MKSKSSLSQTGGKDETHQRKRLTIELNHEAVLLILFKEEMKNIEQKQKAAQKNIQEKIKTDPRAEES